MSDPTANALNSLSYRELRKECAASGIPATGNTQALRKRLLEHVSEGKPSATVSGSTTQPPNVRAESAATSQKRSPAEDLVCPITLELPVDPVMLEDGIVEYSESCGMDGTASSLHFCLSLSFLIV